MQSTQRQPPLPEQRCPWCEVWQFVGGQPLQHRRRSVAQVPAQTAESDAMSKALKKAGFKFIGSTICYAFMQASGMVNDHLVSCHRHAPLCA